MWSAGLSVGLRPMAFRLEGSCEGAVGCIGFHEVSCRCVGLASQTLRFQGLGQAVPEESSF